MSLSFPALRGAVLNQSTRPTGQYRCPTCGRCYRFPQGLKRHILQQHSGDTTQTEFKCDICGHSFRRLDSLQRHQTSIHHLERKFPCPNGCSFSTNNERALYLHAKSCNSRAQFIYQFPESLSAAARTPQLSSSKHMDDSSVEKESSDD